MRKVSYYEKKLSIPSKYWNKNTQRAKETRAFPSYLELNATMDAIENTILSCYRKYKNEHKQDPSLDTFRDLVRIERGVLAVEEKKPVTFLEFVDEFIKDAGKGKHINLANGKPVTTVTVRTYRQTYKLLQSFAHAYKIVLQFDHINPTFHKRFIHYVRQEFVSKETGKSLSINTVGKHITNIKTFMSVAYERKLTTNQDFRMKSFKVITEVVDKIYVSKEEITALHEFDFSANKRLERVRDIFVLGCYTGL